MNKIQFKKERAFVSVLGLIIILAFIWLFKIVFSPLNTDLLQDTLIFQVWDSLINNIPFAVCSTAMLIALFLGILSVYFVIFPFKADKVAMLMGFTSFVVFPFCFLTVVLLMTLTSDNAEAYIATFLFVFGMFKVLPKFYRSFRKKIYNS